MQLPFSYQVRRSHRAKKARIVVSPAKVEVVAPLRLSEKIIKDFVYEKRQWISNALGEMELRQHTVKTLAPASYCNGSEIPYQGCQYKLSILPTKLKRVKIVFNNEFTAFVPASIACFEHNQAIKQALTVWMKKQARSTAEMVAQQHGERYQLFPRSIRIKTQKSRWGSCGIHNDINLNWVLMLAPAEVFEYVVVHELCHIKHRNHSQAFWALVSKHFPNYQQQRIWLNRNGSSLMLGL